MQGDSSGWSQHDLDYATNELAKEYGNISLAIISMVVGLAAKLVAPAEGRLKLLAVARKNLSR